MSRRDEKEREGHDCDGTQHLGEERNRLKMVG